MTNKRFFPSAFQRLGAVACAAVVGFSGAARGGDLGSSPGSPSFPVNRGRTAVVWNWRDSFPALSRACGLSPDNLLRDNRLKLSELKDGQVLRVPAPAWLLSGGDRPATAPASLDARREAVREVWRGIRGRGQVALTYDAGGDPDGAEELLAALEAEHARVTFFVTGEFALRHPALVAAFARGGHTVHNHSHSHPDFRNFDDSRIVGELVRADAAITSASGTRTTRPFWRPPFGYSDARVLAVAAGAGYRSIYWTLDSLDGFGEDKPADFIINRILHPPREPDPARFLDGAIILMHVGKTETARAAAPLIRGLRGMGLEPVPVEEIVAP